MSDATVRSTGRYQAHPTGEVLDLRQIQENAWLNARAGGLNKHYWIVGVLFHVEDPELALDHMTLGADNLVGDQGVMCMVCLTQYDNNADSICMGLVKAEER